MNSSKFLLLPGSSFQILNLRLLLGTSSLYKTGGCFPNQKIEQYILNSAHSYPGKEWNIDSRQSSCPGIGQFECVEQTGQIQRKGGQSSSVVVVCHEKWIGTLQVDHLANIVIVIIVCPQDTQLGADQQNHGCSNKDDSVTKHFIPVELPAFQANYPNY